MLFVGDTDLIMRVKSQSISKLRVMEGIELIKNSKNKILGVYF